MAKDISDNKALALQQCSYSILRLIQKKPLDVPMWTDKFQNTIQTLSIQQIKTLDVLFGNLHDHKEADSEIIDDLKDK